MSICLEVENLYNLIASLQVMGYEPPGKIIQASHGTKIYIFDPDRNRWILHQSKQNN